MAAVAPSLTRTLYRELLRAGRRIEALTRPANAARVRSKLQAFAGDAAPRDGVRAGFRAPSPTAADDAFAALRCAHQTLAWLEPNARLHHLAAARAPTEEGAMVISSVLHTGGDWDEPGEQARVNAELHSLGEAARRLIQAHPEPLTRLHRLALINAIVFGETGVLDRLEPGGRREAPFTGEFDPIRLNSSLAAVTRRRRGLPILLCTVYQAVAARAGGAPI